MKQMKIEEEKAARQRELEIKQKKIEDEKAARQMELELQRKKMEAREREILIQERQALDEAAHRERLIEVEETKHVHLEPLGENDDVDAFIAQFERVAQMCKWSKTSWPTRLMSLLRGRVREAVLRLGADELGDYERIKSALLSHFRLDAEAYREKFRSIKKDAAETFAQMLGRMKRWFSLWCAAAGKDESVAEDVKDLLFQEQFYQLLSPEFTIEVRKTCPKTVEQLATEATVLAEAKRLGRKARQDRTVNQPNQGNRRETAGSQPTGRSQQSDGALQQLNRRSEGPRSTIVCFNCKKPGHIARKCPEPYSVGAVHCCNQPQARVVPTLCRPCAEQQYDPACMVEVNGSPANGLRDTGAGYTVVAKWLVPADAYTGETVPVVLAESRCRSVLPVAVIELKSPFIAGNLEVLVMNSPVQEVLIGNFAKRAGDPEWTRVPVYADPALVGAVQTRAQRAREQQEPVPLPVEECILNTSTQQLIRMQDQDETLRKARSACEAGTHFHTKFGRVEYSRKSGVLVRRFEGPKDVASQICVPAELRTTVMKLGHDVPMSGHLGTTRTKERVSRHFYWPGMHADIRRYC